MSVNGELKVTADQIERAQKRNIGKLAHSDHMEAVRQEGVEEGVRLVAKRMLDRGMELDETAALTGLDLDTVQSLML